MDTTTRDLVARTIEKYPGRPDVAAMAEGRSSTIAVLKELDQCGCTNLLGNGWCDEDLVMVTALCESLVKAIAILEEDKS